MKFNVDINVKCFYIYELLDISESKPVLLQCKKICVTVINGCLYFVFHQCVLIICALHLGSWSSASFGCRNILCL